MIDKTSLSKFMSYALRHGPDEFGLKLDQHGFVSVDELLAAAAGKFPGITEDDVHDVVFNSPKKRFDIKDEKIRASYGHSIRINLGLPTVEPPEILFHGTSRRNVKAIQQNGLKPVSRRYLHLSADLEDARDAGRRRERNPAVVRIRAKDAHKKGVKFYKSGELFLTESIDASYIS